MAMPSRLRSLRRSRRFAVGIRNPYLFEYDAHGSLNVLRNADGTEYVVGGQANLRDEIGSPETWSAEQDATGNNTKISDGQVPYAGAGFDEGLVSGQVDDVLWGLAPDLPPTGRLLELGCGPGFLLEALGKRLPGWSLVGVDPSPTSVSQASDRGVDCRLGFLDTADLEGRFDAFVVMGNFQLHTDPVESLRQLAARANPGAMLFLDSKNPQSSARLLASRLVALPGTKRFGVVHAFAAHSFHGVRHALSRSQLESALRETGWCVNRIRTTGPRLLRFDNTHALSRGLKGNVWSLLDRLDGRTDQRAWIQVGSRLA